MRFRALELPLKAIGARAETARVEVGVLDSTDRLKRAGLGFAAGLAISLVALPIPIVHLVLVPGGLLLGIALCVRRLGQGETFRSAEGRCPYCGTDQRFTLGGPFRLPKTVYCSACQRELFFDSSPLTISTPPSPT